MATTPINKRAPLIGSRTDEGYANKPNEDTFDLFKIGSDPWASNPDDAVYVGIVADGVTSKAGGEQASRIATETIKKTLQRHSPSHLAAQSQQLIDEAIYLANREILEVARKNPEWGSMSTTLVLAAIAGDQLSIAHLGDSRAYLLRGGKLYRLTLDHTWIQEALDLNRITVEEARAHPNRNVIRRYLGINPNIEVDWQIVHPNGNAAETRDYTTTVTLQPDDVILLCSDGLTEKVSDDEILTVLNRHKGAPEKAADLLVKRALAKKETDNITVVLLSYAKRAGLGGWGKWLWIPLLLLLGIFFYTLYTGLGDRLPAEDPAVAVLPAVTATVAATAVPTAIPPTLTPEPTVAPLAATTVVTSMIDAEGEGRLQPTVDATASEEHSILSAATPTKDRPTPTRAPDQPTATPTSTATTEAISAVESEAGSQPSVAQEPDSSSSQSPSGASTDASVTLVRPPADTTLAGPATFEFITGYLLRSGEGFEVVVWARGNDAMTSSYGVAAPLVQNRSDGRYQVTGDLREIIIDGNGNRLSLGAYEWGILVIQIDPYKRLAHLDGKQLINYNPGGGGDSCTGPGCR